MKLSEFLAKNPTLDFDVNDAPHPPAAPPPIGPPVHDAGGYIQYANQGYYEDGATSFGDLQYVAATKALVAANIHDARYHGLDQQLVELLALRGTIHIVPNGLLPLENLGFLHGLTVDDWVAQNEARKHSGGGPSGG